MQPKYAPSAVSYEDLQSQLRFSSSLYAPPKEIKLLNDLRLHIIPETVQLRKKDGNAFLEKTELLTLVEWRS
jgi:hypothetical protein